MIGKLIKHDLKAGARQMGKVYVAALIAFVFMLVSSLTKSGLLQILTCSAVILIAAVAVIVTFVILFVYINRNLYGREGYLSNTLPVRTSSLILSKWVTSCFWVLLSYIIFAVSVVGVYIYATTQNDEGIEAYEMVQMFLSSIGVGATSVYKISLAINAIIGLFNMCILVMFMLFSVTLSNVKPFHKLGGFGVIVYMALTIAAVQGASYGLEQICDISLLIAESGITMTVDAVAISNALATGSVAIGFTSVYFKTIVTVFIYILTVLLAESKINLR